LAKIEPKVSAMQ